MVETLAGQCGQSGFEDGVGQEALFSSSIWDAACAPRDCSVIVSDPSNHALRRVQLPAGSCAASDAGGGVGALRYYLYGRAQPGRVQRDLHAGPMLAIACRRSAVVAGTRHIACLLLIMSTAGCRRAPGHAGVGSHGRSPGRGVARRRRCHLLLPARGGRGGGPLAPRDASLVRSNHPVASCCSHPT